MPGTRMKNSAIGKLFSWLGGFLRCELRTCRDLRPLLCCGMRPFQEHIGATVDYLVDSRLVISRSDDDLRSFAVGEEEIANQFGTIVLL